MSTLQDDQAIEAARNHAALYMNQVDELLLQESAAMTTRSTLGNQIKTDIANNIYNKSDFKAYLAADDLIKSIAIRKPEIKAAMIILKTQIVNITYENELQAVIDTL